MRIFTVGIIISFVAAAAAGCALNPFAQDNIYKRKNPDGAANEMRQPDASAINAEFQKADTNKNGVIS